MGIIGSYYIGAACTMLMIIYFFVYRVFIIKSIIPTKEEGEKAKTHPGIVKWEQEHQRVLNILAGAVLMMILAPVVPKVLIPACLDLKYVVKQEYPVFKGITVNEIEKISRGNDVLGQKVRICDLQDKELIEITMHAETMKKGTYVEVYYLPHLEIGGYVKNSLEARGEE